MRTRILVPGVHLDRDAALDDTVRTIVQTNVDVRVLVAPFAAPLGMARGSRRARSRSWIMRLCMLAGATIVSLVLCELTIRVVAPQPVSWLDIYRRHPTLDLFTLQANVERYIDTGETRWHVKTDARGFRVSTTASESAPAIADPRPLTLCLGDSFIFGYGVEYEESIVGYLEHDLKRRHRFVNAAVGGYGPVQYRQVLEHLLAAGMVPDLVLAGIFPENDFFDCVWSKDERVADGVIGNDGSLRSYVKQHSHLYRLASKAYHRASPADPEHCEFASQLYVAKNWEDGLLRRAGGVFVDELARIAEISAARSIPLFVVVIPARRSVEPGGAAGTHPELPNERATAALTAARIRFIDLTPALAARPVTETYFAHDGHLRPSGNRIAASMIEEHCPELRL